MAKSLSNNQVLMRECITQEFGENEMYTDVSTFFEFFSASQLLKNYDLSDDEIANGVVGGGNDGGCDGMFLFVNNDLLSADQIENLRAPKNSVLHLHIIQAKNETGFGENAIMKWKTVVTNLMDMRNNVNDYSDRYCEQVRDSFQMFRDSITKLIRAQIRLKLTFSYVTVSAEEPHPNCQQQADELKKLIVSMYPSASVEVHFIGADELMDLYNSDVETNVNIVFADQPIALGTNNDYVALVNLGVFYKFIVDDQGKLRSSFFEANVRDYQGKNSVNSCIADTLSGTGTEDFWWLNNGVTILSEKITPVTNRELLIQNPEIVNGLQTSTEIYNYFSANTERINSDKRNVLVRIIVPANEAVRDNIIYATNNQTNIPKSSLRVTDTIHLQIEMYFKNRGLYYDRRKNYYKNLKKKPADIVGVSFLAQCLISVLLRKPDFARARPSTLLTEDETYNLLYEGNHDLIIYYNVAVLGKRVQSFLLKCSEMSSAERNDILYYLLYAVVAKCMNKKNISFDDIKAFDLACVTDEVIGNVKNLVYAKYKELGGNGRVAKSASFVDEIDKLLEIS